MYSKVQVHRSGHEFWKLCLCRKLMGRFLLLFFFGAGFSTMEQSVDHTFWQGRNHFRCQQRQKCSPTNLRFSKISERFILTFLPSENFQL